MFMSGTRLFAVDAGTGKPAAGFGTDGIVNVGVPYNGTPTLYRNVVIIGANVNEVPQGPAGNPRAFDAKTGRKLWEFQTVPKSGAKFNDTWGDGWRERSGTNMWAFAAPVDVERGIVYLPVLRAGRQLLRRRSTGPKRLCQLGRRSRGGDREVPLAFPDRSSRHMGFGHADGRRSDRRDAERSSRAGNRARRKDQLSLRPRPQSSGKPIIPVDERPVPKGDVPTEWYSPTQPFPVRPGPLSRVSFKKEDMVTAADTTAEHAAACQVMWDKSGGFYNAGPFTPFMFHKKGDPPKSTIQFPGGTGGVNWGGMAVDPNNGLHLRERAEHVAGRLGRGEGPEDRLQLRCARLETTVRQSQY